MCSENPAAHLLLVDDDPMTRLLVREALEPEGFAVDEADSGSAGLQAFRRRRPDAVILDVSMPGMDGFACCRELRRLAGDTHVPVIMLTDMNDEQAVDRAFDMGASDFIAKPVPQSLLLHRLRHALGSSRSLQELARHRESLAYAQTLARLGSWEWRRGDAHADWSAGLYTLLGWDAGAAPPRFSDFLGLVPEQERRSLRRGLARLARQGGRHDLEHRLRRADGAECILHHRAECVPAGPGRRPLLRGTVQDVTERRQMEQRIRTLADSDELTGLSNRVSFSAQLEAGLARCAREGSQLALMFIDVDEFKRINDSLGHQVGDRLLQGVAVRLANCLRSSDSGLAGPEELGLARFGADEFTVLLPALEGPDTAARVAECIAEAFRRPFAVDGQELFATVSIGIAVYPGDGRDRDTLLRHADVALHHAKRQGQANCRFFSSQLDAAVHERLVLENALRGALERGEFLLHYQPKVSLATGAVTGAEALVRWHRPGAGLIPPGQFIPLAEETGLIEPLGEWVIREVCRQLAAWRQAGLALPCLAVNLSARQFRQANLALLVRDALAHYGLAPALLELEITEGTLMDDVACAVDTLRQLKAIGVKLSLDDFGTGYSSLSYLKRFPIDRLKIDRAFVRDLTTDPDDAAICVAVIGLAHNLKLAVTAEGVESEGQMHYLRRNRCDEIQGYFFSPPLAAEEFAALLVRPRSLPMSVFDESRPTLLLVDDEPHVLSALKRLLRRDGYEILSAGSAREGFELLSAHPVQVILSDQRMPEMNGTEFLSRVQDMYPDTVRIMLSGFADPQSVTEATRRRAVHRFLSKPWEDEQLREHVREAFRHHNARMGPRGN